MPFIDVTGQFGEGVYDEIVLARPRLLQQDRGHNCDRAQIGLRQRDRRAA